MSTRTRLGLLEGLLERSRQAENVLQKDHGIEARSPNTRIQNEKELSLGVRKICLCFLETFMFSKFFLQQVKIISGIHNWSKYRDYVAPGCLSLITTTAHIPTPKAQKITEDQKTRT